MPFWKRPAGISEEELSKVATSKEQIKKELDVGLNLLRTATSELSSAASDAAENIREEIKNTSRRFFQTIDALDDMLIIKDGDGTWRTLNHHGQHIFGMFHNEYLGKTDAELARLFPFFKDVFEYCITTDALAWYRAKSHRSLEIIPSKDGSGNRYYDVIKTPTFDKEGNRKELLIVGRDVTAQYVENERIKACYSALNSASEPIAIIDADTRIHFCNDQALQLFKIKHQEASYGIHISDVWPDCTLYNTIWDVVSRGNMWKGRCDTLCCDITVHPIRNGHNHPLYYVVNFKFDE